MSARESIIPVFVPHLGCPNDCVFCNQRRISGSTVPAAARDVDKAIEDAAALPRTGAKRQLAFYGGSFTAIPIHEQTALLAAAKAHLDRGDIDSIRLSTRPDAIDGAVLKRLAEYGVETVELGAQSMCDEVLRLAGALGCRAALLKARSPACGSGEVYDGSFSGTLTAGDGVAAAALRAAGIAVFGEDRLPDLENWLKTVEK